MMRLLKNTSNKGCNVQKTYNKILTWLGTLTLFNGKTMGSISIETLNNVMKFVIIDDRLLVIVKMKWQDAKMS